MGDFMNVSNAADQLLGRTVGSGWEVFERLEKGENATGGFFSVCYKVRKKVDEKEQICFLKAFDFKKFFDPSPGTSVIDSIAEMTNSFRYERDISNICKDKHITKVVIVKEANEELVPGFGIPVVPYLIFDLAICDIRQKITFSSKNDAVWKLQSLHSIATGLKQLHQNFISHQDLKPSNILVFDEEHRIGDLGRSQSIIHNSPFNYIPYSGDLSYAPPEILYGSFSDDWNRRAFAIDLYLFGSLAVFYFTGLTMTSLLMDNIPIEFKYNAWQGSYDQVSDYLIDGFFEAMNIISKEVVSSIGDNQITQGFMSAIEQLCHPLPSKRGHPKDLAIKGNPYSLERYVSLFNLLYFQAKFYLR